MKIYDKLIDVLESIVVRPIGLYNKDYRYMVEHLNRNIGNHSLNVSDGYSSPIGMLSNPYYNVQYGKAPWFSYDNDKTRYSNYLDYVRATYGASTSVENINEQTAFPVDFDSIKIGKISGTILNDALTSKNETTFNPNGITNDTKLGKTSAELLKKNILLAIKENDKHNAYKFSISEPMIEYFGLNTNAQQNGILAKFDNVSLETGRFENPSPLDEEISPVYSSSAKWGNYKGLGIYEYYYNNTPSATTRSYIKKNISENKYKPNLPDYSSNSNYLDAMKITVGKATDYKGSQVRYIFSTLHTSDTEYNNEGHTKDSLIGGLKAYGEKEGNFNGRYSFESFNPGINFGKYTTFDADPIGVEDLLYKTNQGFVNGKYDTLIARFHSDTDYPNDDLMSSSVSKAYGMSHGRNLLRGDAKHGRRFTENGVGDGYDNPYCRVWTYHHQYHRMKDTIRPFTENDKVLTPAEIQRKYGWDKFRTNDTVEMGTGGERLTKYGVIGYKSNAGLVNIAPKKGVDIRSCMFSIENLAWKDVLKSDPSALSKEQVGPFGGRIMWFPPYGISFSEQVSANWNSTDFIGRGESIYTYTNTNRTGTLSFQILIDHPAILDYWKRRNDTDSSSSVDDVDFPEQQLLRFFAGCDMLTSKEADKTPKPVPVKDTPEPKPTSTAFTFFVFYPNDYSGEDDSANNFAIPYLLNGVGTQYYIDNSNGSHRDNPTMSIWTNMNDNQIGGYEVRNKGISVVTKKIHNPDNKSLITTVKGVNNPSYKLAKQIGSYSGRRIEWYYRVDNKRRNEKLVLANDYIDLKSYRLNSGGNKSAIKSTFGIKDNTPLYALTDVYVALTDDSTAKETLKGCYNANNVATIQQLVDKYGIKEITVKGWASSHGITHNVSRNNDLNKNRRNTVLRWLKTCSRLRNKNIAYKALAGGVGPGPKASSVSELKPKLYRCAEVTVYINTSKTTTAQNTVKERVSESTQQNNTGKAKAMMFARAAKKQAKTSNKYRISNIVVDKSVEVPDKTRVAKFPNTNLHYSKEDSVKKLKALANKVKTDVSSYTNKNKTNAKNTTSTSNYSVAAAEQKNIKDANTTNEAANTNIANSSLGIDKPLRYDNEADFFKGLELNDPFMREKITEKIKYFDPAFHSISPEGFNARLTFLHQCTRQGPTIGNSDQQVAGGTTANNLAFGRPPICILRLGDFYYTKIVITSLNISYDPLQWDLNTEGIGVMPMIAKIDMNFNFIGGSNLSGPISRLQNAISFNYYANAEVYDDRAEQVTYDSNGEIDKYKTFPN